MSIADDYALLWTATSSGNATGIRFMATVEDAQKWCSSPLSQGTMHGTQWAYFWTTVANYVRKWGAPDGTAESIDATVVLADFDDSGEWDERIASTGCRMIKSDEARRILADAGIFNTLGRVIAPPKMSRPAEPTLFDLLDLEVS